jgi:TatD DNase family protein
MIDVHCHIDIYSEKEIKDIVQRAKGKGINIIINAGINVKTNRKTLELAKKFKEIKASLGIYPGDALKLSEKEIASEIRFIKENKNKIVAVGEVGIDLKENKDLEKQKENFRKFIRLSREIKKPIIVHSRKAEKECIELLEEENATKVLMHCFSGNKRLVQRIKENKWFFSIPTNVKFSEHFQNLIKEVPISQLLCETDSPFLHPDKKRNNTPENVIESYKKISEIKGISFEETERIIEKNFKMLFGE